MTVRELGEKLLEVNKQRERLSHIADTTNNATLYFQAMDKILERDTQSERLALRYDALKKAT